MKRFLDSLNVHVQESKKDLQDVHSRLFEVTNQYKTLSKTATLRLNQRTIKKRARTVASTSKNVYAYNMEMSRNQLNGQKNKIHYTPASQYPVPMQPRLFKPTVNSFNAERVAKLAEMRPLKVETNEIPDIPDDSSKLPTIEIEKLCKKE